MNELGIETVTEECAYGWCEFTGLFLMNCRRIFNFSAPFLTERKPFIWWEFSQFPHGFLPFPMLQGY